MTDAELDALVALGEGITPGPWLFNNGEGHRTFLGGFYNAEHDTVCTFGYKASYHSVEGEQPSPEDARAIAAVPDLIAALTTLRGERDIYRQKAETFGTACGEKDAEITTLRKQRDELREALTWYAEQVAGCRKIGSIGRPFQIALNDDGGERARQALSNMEGE